MREYLIKWDHKSVSSASEFQVILWVDPPGIPKNHPLPQNPPPRFRISVPSFRSRNFKIMIKNSLLQQVKFKVTPTCLKASSNLKNNRSTLIKINVICKVPIYFINKTINFIIFRCQEHNKQENKTVTSKQNMTLISSNKNYLFNKKLGNKYKIQKTESDVA